MSELPARVGNHRTLPWEQCFTPEPNSGCWLWLLHVGEKGYAHIWDGNKVCRAHRHIYELVKGRIPDGLEPDHKCRVRSCVNPDHIELVTHAENIRRAQPHMKRELCSRGHRLEEPNLYHFNGRRTCKACAISRARSKSRTALGLPDRRVAANKRRTGEVRP